MTNKPVDTPEILKKCDQALTACDAALRDKEEQVKKQKELIQKQSEELSSIKSDRDNPLTLPVVWASVTGAAVALAGPIAIPFAVIGSVVVGIIFQ